MRWNRWPMVISLARCCSVACRELCCWASRRARDRVFIADAANWVSKHTAADAVVVDTEGLISFYSDRAHIIWPRQDGSAVWEDPPWDAVQAAARQHPVILAHIFQTESGEKVPDHIGDWTRAGPVFAAIGARHGDVLAIYARHGEGIIRP